MKYMLLIHAAPGSGPAPGTPEFDARRAAWIELTSTMEAEGVHVSGAALQPDDTATTIRVRGGEDVLTDGPFAETREMLAGYYVLDVPDLDAALAWARRLPNIEEAAVEVRPVMEVTAAA